MNHPDRAAPPVGGSWETYWQGSGEAGAYTAGGAGHPAIRAFWLEFFQAVQQVYQGPAMLDIASGNGAVAELALQFLGEGLARVACVDVSEAAVANIQGRLPRVEGVVADAKSIPLESESFDIVTSQFGIEYAGSEAVSEAERLLKRRGRMGFLMHARQGSIHQECARNLKAAGELRESRFVECAADMFRAGFEAVRGAGREAYEEAAKRLAPSVSAVEQIIRRDGEQVADGTISRLYSDVARIHGEIQSYEPDEVLGWLDRMTAEIEAYAGRMSSMIESALDEDGFKRLCQGLHGRGFLIETAGPFQVPDNERPMAWALVARK